MPTRKIENPKSSKVDSERCHNPEHDPPRHVVFESGLWEHTCPGCGKVTRFEVPEIYW